MNKFLLAAMALALTTGPVSAQLQWESVAPVAKKSNLFPEGKIKLSANVTSLSRSTRAGEEEGVPFSAKTLSNMGGWNRNIYETNKEDVGQVYSQVFGEPLTGKKLQVATAYDPALLARFDGNTITKINTRIGPNCKNIKAFILDGMTGKMLWEGPQLPGVNNTSLKSRDVSFKCDYVIDKNVLILVGFEVVAKSSSTTIPAVDNVVSNGLLMGNGEGFIDLSASGIAAYIDCETDGQGGLKDNDVKVVSLTGGRVLADGEYQATASFINYGVKPVASLNTAYTVNEKTAEESLNAQEAFPYMTPIELKLKAKSPAEAARYLQNFTITKVNGVDDDFTETNVITNEEDNTAYNVLTSIAQPYPRVAVMEEFTGTWCPWCPRGIVAMDKAAKAYPDGFIGIAVHANDEMGCEEYNPLLATVGNFPSAMLNRIGYNTVDPYYGFQGQAEKEGEVNGDVLNDIKIINQLPVEAKVGLATSLKGNSIEISSAIDFSLNAPGKGYSLAYVLLENGITGYPQKNAYNKDAGAFKSAEQIAEEDLRFLFNEGKKGVYMPTFNHVARSIKDAGGIQGSLDNVDFKAGETATHTYTLDLPASVKNKENLEVAVLLLDVFTGEILNAAKVKVGESTTGVESVKADAAEISVANGAIEVNGNGVASVYTVDGKLVSNVSVNGSASIPTMGLNGVYVVRVVDGANVTVKKVLL